LSIPLSWFPRLLNATQQEREQWRLIGAARVCIGKRSTKISPCRDYPASPATSAMLSSDANLLALGVYDSVPIRTPAQFLKDYGQA